MLITKQLTAAFKSFSREMEQSRSEIKRTEHDLPVQLWQFDTLKHCQWQSWLHICSQAFAACSVSLCVVTTVVSRPCRNKVIRDISVRTSNTMGKLVFKVGDIRALKSPIILVWCHVCVCVWSVWLKPYKTCWTAWSKEADHRVSRTLPTSISGSSDIYNNSHCLGDWRYNEYREFLIVLYQGRVRFTLQPIQLPSPGGCWGSFLQTACLLQMPDHCTPSLWACVTFPSCCHILCIATASARKLLVESSVMLKKMNRGVEWMVECVENVPNKMVCVLYI